MSRITGPLFKWFGSKWLSSKTLPIPQYKDIVEPFAGSAGYSLRYYEQRVVLYESNSQLYKLWDWLINVATEASIREIPVNLPDGIDIRGLKLHLTEGQRLLLKHWQRTNSIGNCWTTTSWSDGYKEWSESVRSRIAEEVTAIKHWKLAGIDGIDGLQAFDDKPCTWFVDPPYLYNYAYRSAPLDYDELGRKLLSCKGQVIACEARCQKTGLAPTYLPFVDFGKRITSRRKAGNNMYSNELMYHHVTPRIRNTGIT